MRFIDEEKMMLWIARMKAPYRLIIRNDETLEEKASFRLSILNVYVLLSSIVVLMAISMILLIAYTPIKRYIPGYMGSGGREGRALVRLAKEVRELEISLEANEKYSDNLRRLLAGEVQTEKDVQQLFSGEAVKTTKPKPVATSDEDWQLRQEDEFSRLAEVSRQGRGNNSFGPQDRSIEQLFFIAPVRGEISAPFSLAKNHLGIDVVAPKNTAIRAVMDGYVFLADWTLETGNTIAIQHSNNVITFYKHNAALLKKTGSFVRAGEAIAIIGNTGDLTSGPHLHFELWYRGKAVDPADYIAF
jgi:murein DD-endopeptidase MepM/ murein hydrolase activator NlpD